MDKELELEAEDWAEKFKTGGWFVRLRKEAFIAGATTSSRVKKLENRVEELEDGLRNLIEGVQEYFDERKSNSNNKNSGVLFKRISMAFRLAASKQLLTNKSK